MIEQLGRSFELLLMNYGIWIALALVLMVLLPVILLIWAQRRHQQQDNDQLSAHYEALAALQQQLNGMETLLSQSQQQSSHFSAATRQEAGEILQQQEDCLARVLRMKSELRETEAHLPQLGDQLPARLEDAEAEVAGLKLSFEKISAWYKQLHQSVADCRTQLHRLQSELEALGSSEGTASLWSRLQALQAETSPADPLQYQQALQSLEQDIRELRSLPPLPFEAAPSPELAQTIDQTPIPPSVASHLPVTEAPQTASSPQAEPPMSVETPISAGPPISADGDDAPELIVEQTPDQTLNQTPDQTSPQPAAEPEQVDQEQGDQDRTQAELEPESEPESEDTTRLNAELNAELEQALEDSTDEAPVSGASFNLSQLTSEQVMALRQGMPLTSASAVDPAEPSAGLAKPSADLSDELVTETFLGQRGDSADENPSEQALTQASDLDAEPVDQVRTGPLVDEAVVTETFLGQRGSEVGTKADLPSGTGFETGPFADARAQLVGLDARLEQIETDYRQLENSFVPEAWPEALPLLERSRYLAAESTELFKLAQRLRELPQAPSHRVQLNLRRLQQKCQQLDVSRASLVRVFELLNDETAGLNARLISATEQLQGLRERAETEWISTQAGRLRQVYQALEHQPFHLPACRQQLRQVEIEIESQAQL
ncbi:MAG: hypothetical protein CVV27_05130 [Candidatus Melainabacteria bacterium HGW-Melainabacteria-1]|nr:MAG: hypothetical protein CVV27_05130 [Candidatus Melainabacteria bacterium HGW-Melainabacteria-1]